MAMANNTDPDQTVPSGAVWSGSVLFVYAFLLETLKHKILFFLVYLFYFIFLTAEYYYYTGILHYSVLKIK